MLTIVPAKAARVSTTSNGGTIKAFLFMLGICLEDDLHRINTTLYMLGVCLLASAYTLR